MPKPVQFFRYWRLSASFQEYPHAGDDADGAMTNAYTPILHLHTWFIYWSTEKIRLNGSIRRKFVNVILFVDTKII